MIHFQCKLCGNRLKAADEHAGKSFRCPRCHESIQVPAAENSLPAGRPLTATRVPPVATRPEGEDLQSRREGNREPSQTQVARAVDAAGGNMPLKRVLFSFQGRIGRATFWAVWGTMMFLSLLVGLLSGVVGTAGKGAELIGMIIHVAWMVPLVWIMVAVQVKRWQDMDMSGWMILIGAIPIVGLLIALVFLGFVKGTIGSNRYGDEPFQSRLQSQQKPQPGGKNVRRAASQTDVRSKTEVKPGEISSGAAGLILVGSSLLHVVFRASKEVGDVFWFIGAFGVLTSLVGLVISIIGVAKNSGRTAGFFGVLAYVALAVIFMALRI